MNTQSAKEHVAAVARELLPVVDENDVEIDALPRAEVHRRKLRHRAIHIVLENARGEILLQRRSLLKDTFPGAWDVSVGGHVNPRESYLDAASREIGEELGIAAPPTLERFARLQACELTGWEFMELFTGRHEGPFSPPATEISEVRWMDAGRVLDDFANSPDWCFSPSGLNTMRLWREWKRARA